jgi:fumarate hydratase, class II
VLYREAQAKGRPLRELVVERGLASGEQFDAWTQ